MGNGENFGVRFRLMNNAATSQMLRRTAALVLSTTLVACSTSAPYVWVHEFSQAEQQTRIQDGDRISVQVKDQSTLSGEFPVRGNGAYLQPVVGEIHVAGLTVEEAAAKLAKRLDGVVVKPLVAISVATPRALRITVIGEVRTPGQYELAPGSNVVSALARAGGLSEFARSDGVYVVRKAGDHPRVRFRYKELVQGDGPSLGFRLMDGDIVVVE